MNMALRTRAFSRLYSSSVTDSWTWTPEVTLKVLGPDASLLEAHLPPGTGILARAGSALTLSPGVSLSPTTDGGPLVALSRTLSGGHLLFHSISAPQIPAAQSNKDFKEERVTLAPLSSTSGQISLVPLDGTVEMRVLQGSFLAATSKLSLAARLGGLGWSANGLFCYQVKGRGTLALSGPGGLHSLTLAEGESVRVNPRHIVAWDACLDVKAPEREGGSTKEVPVVAPATPVAEMEWQDRALALAKKSVSWTASKTAQVSRSALQSAKERVLGSQEFYTVTGPGLLLLSRSASSKIGGAFKEE